MSSLILKWVEEMKQSILKSGDWIKSLVQMSTEMILQLILMST